ncbi:MAG: SRPBCC family protein [Asticcacaulis sp.]
MTRTVLIERELRHPPEKVWRALTQAPLIADWLMQSDFEPVVGHEFTFRAQPVQGWDGVVKARVLTVDAPRELAYTWGSMGLDSVVTWTLTPTGAGTHLRMEQTGFGDDQTANYNGAVYGWTRFIGALETVLDGLKEG